MNMLGGFLVIAGQIMAMAAAVSVALLLLGIGVLVLIHVCIVGRAFRGGIVRSAARRGDEPVSGLSPEDLEKLPCYEYKAGEKGGADRVDCVVCLESFQAGERCRLLPLCKHSFHSDCVDSWLLRMPVCPICRASAGLRKGSEGGVNPLGGFVPSGDGLPVVVGISVTGNQRSLHASSLD